jgi:hypothetical protein
MFSQVWTCHHFCDNEYPDHLTRFIFLFKLIYACFIFNYECQTFATFQDGVAKPFYLKIIRFFFLLYDWATFFFLVIIHCVVRNVGY